jgi:CHAT domain-containing protein
VKSLFFIILIFLSYISSAQIPADTLRPDAFLEQAQRLLAREQTDSAAVYLNQAARAFAGQKDWQKSLLAKKQEADIYFRQRRSEEAIQAYTYLLDSLAGQASDTVRGEAYYQIGLSYARLASFVDALENVKKSTEVRSQTYPETHPILAETFHLLGRLYFVIGDYWQSLRYQQKFLKISRTLYGEEHPQVGEALLYVGLSYSRLYEHELALEYYFKCAELLKKNQPDNFHDLASTYNNIGLVYGREGAFEKELEYMMMAISLNGSKSSNTATNYHNVGRAYFDLGEYDKSFDYLHQAVRMKIAITGPNHTTVSKSYNELANLHQRLKNFDSAIYYQQQALKIQHDNFGQYSVELSDTYRDLGGIYLELEDYPRAIQQYQRAIAAIVENYDTANVAALPTEKDIILERRSLSHILQQKGIALYRRYLLSGQQEDLQLAHATNMASAELLEGVYARLNNKESISFLARNSLKIYEQCLQTALALQETQAELSYLKDAFSVMERNKARLLLQNIAESRWKAQANVADSLLEQEQAIKSQLAYYEKLRFEEHTRENSDSLRLAEVQSDIFRLHRQLEGIYELMPIRHTPNGMGEPTQQFASLQQVQRQLMQPGQMLLEYFEGENMVYGMAVSRNEASLFAVEETSRFRPMAEQMIQGLRNKNYTDYAVPAHQLYKQLIAGALEHSNTAVDALLIVPDGSLGYIPFEALLSSSPPTAPLYHQLDYLILDHNLAYQYSASLLSQVSGQQQTDFKYPFMGYAPAFSKQGNPLLATRSSRDRQLVDQLQELPYAQEEVRSIASLLQGNSLTESQATESNFKKTAGEGRIIHLASHTLIDDQNPLYSRLVFSREDSGDEDGLLHTYELYNMRLASEMVTLSACNTGMGQIRAGEGIISLARGFMYAGVTNVLMSLWAVSDRSTSELMQYFYQSLKDGHSKSEALRQAKLEYLRRADANTAAPYYWSGFILISSQQDQDSTPKAWLYFSLVMGACIFGGWFLFRRKKIRQKH